MTLVPRFFADYQDRIDSELRRVIAAATGDRVQEAMAYAGVYDLARPTLDAGESVADFLAADDGFDPDQAGERDYGFVRLQQLALEHLIG